MDECVRRALIAIRGLRQVTLGVISGRALEDLQARVDVVGIYYGGNHGLEIVGPGLQFTESKTLAAQAELQEVLAQLVVSLWPIPGVRVEDKRLSAAIHFGLVADFHVPEIRSAVDDAVAPYAAKFEIRAARKSFDSDPG